MIGKPTRLIVTGGLCFFCIFSPLKTARGYDSGTKDWSRFNIFTGYSFVNRHKTDHQSISPIEHNLETNIFAGRLYYRHNETIAFGAKARYVDFEYLDGQNKLNHNGLADPSLLIHHLYRLDSLPFELEMYREDDDDELEGELEVRLPLGRDGAKDVEYRSDQLGVRYDFTYRPMVHDGYLPLLNLPAVFFLPWGSGYHAQEGADELPFHVGVEMRLKSLGMLQVGANYNWGVSDPFTSNSNTDRHVNIDLNYDINTSFVLESFYSYDDVNDRTGSYGFNLVFKFGKSRPDDVPPDPGGGGGYNSIGGGDDW